MAYPNNPSTNPDLKEKQAFAKGGWIFMALAVIGPPILFIGLLPGNWNESNPWPTFLLTGLAGFLASSYLVKWAIIDSIGWVAVGTGLCLIIGAVMAWGA